MRYRGYAKLYTRKQAAQIYDQLIKQSLELGKLTGRAYVEAVREIRTDFTRDLSDKLGHSGRLGDGDILIDLPPAGRDQVRNIFVVDHGEPYFVQDLTPMAEAVSETFKYWVREFRVFCAPDVFSRLPITRGELAAHCWSVLADRYLQKDLFNETL